MRYAAQSPRAQRWTWLHQRSAGLSAPVLPSRRRETGAFMDATAGWWPQPCSACDVHRSPDLFLRGGRTQMSAEVLTHPEKGAEDSRRWLALAVIVTAQFMV